MLAAPPNPLFRPGKKNSLVFLTLDSFMVHDNPRPRNQSQKYWCLATDRNSISIRDKPDAFFMAGKLHFACGFLPTAKLGSGGFAESKALCYIY